MHLMMLININQSLMFQGARVIHFYIYTFANRFVRLELNISAT